MNCAEAVKPAPILWKPRENKSRTQSPRQNFARAKESREEISFWFLIRADPRKSAAKWFGVKNKCGSASHRAASFVDSCLPCHRLATALSDGMTASVRQRSRSLERRIVTLAKASCPFVISRRQRCNRCGGQRPLFLARCPAPKEQKDNKQEGEAATPGQPVALARVSDQSPGNSPSRIAGCRWLCRNHPASTGTLTFR